MNEKEKLINILLAIAILILIALNISLFITHNSHLSEEKNVTATNNIELDLNNRTPKRDKSGSSCGMPEGAYTAETGAG